MISLKLDQLGPRERIGLGIAVFCILALLIDRLVVASLLTRFRELDVQIVEAAGNVAYNRRVMKQRDEVAREYETVKGMLGETSSPAATIDAMKGEIDDLARKAGVVLFSMEHRDPEKEEFYQTFLVEVGNFEADMQSLLGFLHELRNRQGMLRVSRLSVGPKKGTELVRGSILITKVMMLASGTPPADA